jgi:hypothetical protein
MKYVCISDSPHWFFTGEGDSEQELFNPNKYGEERLFFIKNEIYSVTEDESSYNIKGLFNTTSYKRKDKNDKYPYATPENVIFISQYLDLKIRKIISPQYTVSIKNRDWWIYSIKTYLVSLNKCREERINKILE